MKLDKSRIKQQQQQQQQGAGVAVEMMRFQRRNRTRFNKFQLDFLHEAFKRNHYPEPQVRNQLAAQTGLDPSRIQVWFQNQRAKDRKRRGSHTSSYEEERNYSGLSPPSSLLWSDESGGRGAPIRPPSEQGSTTYCVTTRGASMHARQPGNCDTIRATNPFDDDWYVPPPSHTIGDLGC